MKDNYMTMSFSANTIIRYVYIVMLVPLLVILNGDTAKAVLAQQNQIKRFISLTFQGNQLTSNDTLILVVGPKNLDNINASGILIYREVINELGQYNFKVPVTTSIGYWKLLKVDANATKVNHKTLTIPFLWEVGDSISVELSNPQKVTGTNIITNFNGRGYEKYICRQKAMSSFPIIERIASNSINSFNVPDLQTINYKLKIVDECSIGMSTISKQMLKADICFVNGLAIYSAFRDYILKNSPDSSGRERLLERSKAIFSIDRIQKFDSITVANSPQAIKYFFFGLKTQSIIKFGEERPIWIYDQIKIRYSATLRDELIGYQFAFERNDSKVDSIYNDAMNVISESGKMLLRSVSNLYNRKQFGKYTLNDPSGKDFDLSKLQGKVIILDVWFTGCGACSIYYNDVLSYVKQYFKDDKSVAFVSISIDQSRERWVNSINSGMYTDKETTYNFYTGKQNLNHPFVKDNNITGAPTVMLIDSKNRIDKFNTLDLYNIPSLITAIKNAK